MDDKEYDIFGKLLIGCDDYDIYWVLEGGS